MKADNEQLKNIVDAMSFNTEPHLVDNGAENKKKWVVYRCWNDGYETWRKDVAEFESEIEADQYAENEQFHDGMNIWYEVEEEV